MSKNYIEVTHTSTDEDGWVSEEVWFATRPTESIYYKGERPVHEKHEGSWRVEGSTVTIYNKEDITGIRLLLDAIEAEIDAEEAK